MEVVTIIVASAAVVSAAFAGGAAYFARVSADAAKETVRTDQAADRRQRQPQLIVKLEELVRHNSTVAVYRITNTGPADLDSVIVHQPVPGSTGNISHPVASSGRVDFAEKVDVGPIAMGAYGRFTLSLGSGTTLPEFWVKIVSRVHKETWDVPYLLEYPRKPKPRQSRIVSTQNHRQLGS